MMYIKLANKIIKITNMYPVIEQYAADYVWEADDDSFDFSIETTQADIDYERVKAKREAPFQELSDGYLETLAIYRKIALKMLDHNIILFHGSVIAVDGVAYLFTAKSGTGKSTHTRLWREYFGDRAIMINDDKPFLKLTDEGVVAYGTPWSGKHHLDTNRSAPLKAICILKRDKENHIECITKKEAYDMLVQQTYRPADPEKLMKTLQLIDRLLDRVRMYQLGCNMEKEAAVIAYEGMK